MTGLLSEYLTRDELAAELRVTVRTIARWQAQPDGLSVNRARWSDAVQAVQRARMD